jgi:outer membrane protein
MKRNISAAGRKLIILFVILSGSSSLWAQKYYTLEECVNQAFKSNISVKQRELNMQSAESDRLRSKLNLLPNLNGQASHNYNIGFAINPVTNTAERDVTFRSNTFGLSSSLTLFSGFQNLNTVKQQSANVKASSHDVTATKNNIALSVSNAYMQVLMNTEIVESRKLQIQSTSEQLKRQEKLYELGGVNRVKLLQLRAQYASEESQLVTAQAQLDQSYLTLWQLMNMVPDTNNRIIKPDSSIMSNIANENQTADNIYKDFMNKSPEVLAAKERAELSRIAENIALGGRSPRLTLSAGINSFYTTQNVRPTGTTSTTLIPIGVDINGNPVYSPVTSFSGTQVVPFSEQFDKSLGKNIGVTLSVPIFNGGLVNNQVQKARINRVGSDLTQKQTELDLYKNINQAYLDFKSTQKRFDANLNNYDANKEALALAEAQFNLGALNTSDYIVTKNQYLQAETTLLQSKYELLFRRKVLDFYLGKPLY